jgi:hypothetical protein
MLKMKTAAGPDGTVSSVDVDFGEFEKVNYAIATMTGGYLCRVAISGVTVTVTPMYFDYDAAADGAAIDVPLATDLSGETITVIADGE